MSRSTTAAASASSFLALSCVGFIATAPAHATDTPSASVHAPVAADPQTQRQQRDGDREIIVTGEREAEVETPKATAPLLDTPQTITVISDQTLRKQNLLTLRDALQTIPGITFGAGEGGGGYGDSINLRGYSANNDITIDGIRDLAQYSRTDPFNLQQIEVYNGANSVQNGAGSLGGTINLVSKVPQPRDLTIVQAGVGTDNYYRATVDSNVRVNDLVAVRLNGMYHHNDVPRRDVEKLERWGVAPSITLGVEGPTSLTLAYVHQEDDNIPVYGVPYYAAVGGRVPGIDDSDYFGIENLDQQASTVDRMTVTFRHEFTDDISIRNLTRWQRVVQDSHTSAPQGTICLTTGLTPQGVACPTTPTPQNTPGFFYPSGPRGLVRDQMNNTLVNQTDLRFIHGEKGGLRNTLNIGLFGSLEEYSIETAQLLRNPGGALPNPVLPPISITNPNTTYTGPINRTLTGISYGDTDNVAVYAFDTLELSPMFELSGGVRWEYTRTVFRADTYATPATGGAVTVGAPQLNEDKLLSYRVGAVFKPVTNASLYIAYANSETPTSASVRAGCAISSIAANCAVAPEQGKSYEVGGKLDLAGGRLQLNLAAFRNDRTNYRVASNDPVQPTIQVLDGSARVDGIAAGVTGSITRNWTIFANYTYLDSEILQGVSDFCVGQPGTGCGNSAANPDPLRGNVLQQTPRHSGSLFTSYKLPFGLEVGYGLTYQGSFALNQSTLAAPVQLRSVDFTTHRAFVSYAFRNGLTAQVNVQNLTDARYYTGIRNNGWATPAEGRQAVLNLFYSF